jgi:hypothetical protein
MKEEMMEKGSLGIKKNKYIMEEIRKIRLFTGSKREELFIKRSLGEEQTTLLFSSESSFPKLKYPNFKLSIKIIQRYYQR